jgi:hypothetical protein
MEYNGNRQGNQLLLKTIVYTEGQKEKAEGSQGEHEGEYRGEHKSVTSSLSQRGAHGGPQERRAKDKRQRSTERGNVQSRGLYKVFGLYRTPWGLNKYRAR